jgi:hypothetical protein
MKTRFLQSMILVVCLVWCTLFSHVQAQVPDSQFVEDAHTQNVLVDVSPENPEPNQQVTFQVISFLSDIDRSTITWLVNGKRASSGTGIKTFSTTMGNVGTKTVVTVVVVTPDGTTVTKTIPLTSANVDLIWEADSYTPPFYQGKALLTPYQGVRIVAIPHLGNTTTTLSPTNLIYTWQKDGRILGSQSGYGKNILILDPTLILRPATIVVTVSDKADTLHAQGVINLQPTQPRLVTYLYSQAYGLLSNIALQGTVQLPSKEINIAATPYFFNQTSVPYLNYTWIMNDSPISETTGSILTVRNDATSTGISTISVGTTDYSNTNLKAQSSSFSLSF